MILCPVATSVLALVRLLLLASTAAFTPSQDCPAIELTNSNKQTDRASRVPAQYGRDSVRPVPSAGDPFTSQGSSASRPHRACIPRTMRHPKPVPWGHPPTTVHLSHRSFKRLMLGQLMPLPRPSSWQIFDTRPVCDPSTTQNKCTDGRGPRLSTTSSQIRETRQILR